MNRQERDMEIANTILAQLGGKVFTMMTGAGSFAGGRFDGEPGLSMKIPGRRGMIITLNVNDTYDLHMIRPGFFRKGEWVDSKDLAVEKDIYVENLRQAFESMTGLYVSIAG